MGSSALVTDFWKAQYLETYIAEGGSKIKFLTGGDESGRSLALCEYLRDAEACGYKTAYISAKKTWLHDFKDIYVAVFDDVDFEGCLSVCADHIVKELGYDPATLPEGMDFASFLQDRSMFDPLTKREIREKLSEMFFGNTWIDNNFAISAALITGGILGYPQIEPAAKDLLLAWHRGEKEARVSVLRKLGLSPSRITKNNARHMLRSLAEIIRISGYKGLAIAIDNLEMLASASALEEIRYTKMRREDAYESIREMIDGIDTFSHFMLAFAFGKELLEDELCGLKSYQALWMRIQNEIESERMNRFADIIDLNKAGQEVM
jgi:hypothetical protein